MRGFEVGDRVRVDIPDRADPDFGIYHERVGKIVKVIEDEAGAETGDPRDNHLFRVKFVEVETIDFRWRDLRPSG